MVPSMTAADLTPARRHGKLYWQIARLRYAVAKDIANGIQRPRVLCIGPSLAAHADEIRAAIPEADIDFDDMQGITIT